MHAALRHLDADLVRRLVARQFPQWADLPVVAVAPGGWDNRTFRLGEDLTVRLPSAARYAAAVAREHLWLPYLAPHLPLAIPAPIGRGAPDASYPWPWSIYRWIRGEPASTGGVEDRVELARTLARWLRALQAIDAAGGPEPGPDNFFRGGPLATYDAETKAAIAALGSSIDGAGAARLWQDALAARWFGPPVWVHGDVSPGNLLVRDGRLAAVIDFGQLCIGDPACDLAIAWTFLDGESRATFADALGADPDTWARARGWALWKALIVLARLPGANTGEAAQARRVLAALLGG